MEGLWNGGVLGGITCFRLSFSFLNLSWLCFSWFCRNLFLVFISQTFISELKKKVNLKAVEGLNDLQLTRDGSVFCYIWMHWVINMYTCQKKNTHKLTHPPLESFYCWQKNEYPNVYFAYIKIVKILNVMNIKWKDFKISRS